MEDLKREQAYYAQVRQEAIKAACDAQRASLRDQVEAIRGETPFMWDSIAWMDYMTKLDRVVRDFIYPKEG